MAASSLAAVGSGLDIPTLVSNLVANERKPIANRINTQGAAATAKFSALSNIKSSLGSMQTSLDALTKSAGLLTYKTTVPEGSGFGAGPVEGGAKGPGGMA